MDLDAAEKLALELMDHHGVRSDGWSFGWSRSVRQFGAAVEVRRRRWAKAERRELRLSRRLVQLNDESEVRDTILHEIAHILAGIKNGHNQIWKQWARKIGAEPTRCYDQKSVKTPPPKYEIWCGGCERVVGTRHRRLKRGLLRRMVCRGCGRSTLGRLAFRSAG
jgi:predicted SprT family Zn-dependent metalloprotease